MLGRGKERNSAEASKPQSFLGFQFKCLYNQHIHKALIAQWAPKAEGNSIHDFHRRKICRRGANLHGDESWIARCSQEGRAREVSKAWFPMESLLPRSLAFLFPSLPPVHAGFSAVDLATALVAQFEIS